MSKTQNLRILNVFILFCLCFFLGEILETDRDISSSNVELVENAAFFSPTPILIDPLTEFDWNWALSTGLCTGSGTYEDPYLFNELYIDLGISADALTIKNSHAYVIINNSQIDGWIETGSVSNHRSCLYLENCSNITVYNCTLKNSNHGINARNSAKIVIENNTIENTYYGIYFYGTSLSNITHNQIRKYSIVGVQLLWLSSNLFVAHNFIGDCVSNYCVSISITASNNLNFKNNNISHYILITSGSGISMDTSNTRNGKLVYYYEGLTDLTIDGNLIDAGQIIINSCSKIIVQNLNSGVFDNFLVCMSSFDIEIKNCVLSSNSPLFAMRLGNGYFLFIHDCFFTGRIHLESIGSSTFSNNQMIGVNIYGANYSNNNWINNIRFSNGPEFKTQNNTVIKDCSFIIEWNAVAGASGYQIIIDQNEPILTSDLFVEILFTKNGTYIIQIRAIDEFGLSPISTLLVEKEAECNDEKDIEEKEIEINFSILGLILGGFGVIFIIVKTRRIQN